MTALRTHTIHKCIHLRRLDLPENLSTMKKECICDCENLKMLVLPDNIKFIEEGAITNCEGLEWVLWRECTFNTPEELNNAITDSGFPTQEAWK